MSTHKVVVTAEELSKRQLAKEENLVVLDIAFKSDRTIDAYTDIYLKGHIPGARFFDLHCCVTSTPLLPRNIPEVYCFTKKVRRLGIHGDTDVVVYDHSTPEAAARAWWTFRLFGHHNVYLLDGGFKKWVADGREVETEEPPEAVPTSYELRLNADLIRDLEDTKRILDAGSTQIVDTRGQAFFSGDKDHSQTLIGGHVPGAKNLPLAVFFNQDGTYKTEEEIRKLFSSVGVDLSKPLVAMCRTGMTACCLVVAAYKVGVVNIPVYYGSWMEWAQSVEPAELYIAKEDS